MAQVQLNEYYPVVGGPYVYALVDPGTHFVHYVGRTGNLDSRLTAHMALGSKGYRNAYMWAWLSYLRAQGERPTMMVLETPWGKAFNERRPWIKQREKFWIHHMIGLRQPLLNREYVSHKVCLSIAVGCDELLTEWVSAGRGNG